MWTLTDVERAVRTSWGVDMCDPVDRQDWHPGNPARGQCGVTALVLNDLFGGRPGGPATARPTQTLPRGVRPAPRPSARAPHRAGGR